MAKAVELLNYFKWCYKGGAEYATELNYVPIPENVIKLVEKLWAESIKADGRPACSQ
jgi:phosphate transport system substrate-binding protein